MFFLKFILSILIILINFNSILKAETLTFPTNLVANTTGFVLLSTSGTTPSISGYSGTLLFSAVASAGNIKVTDTSNVKVRFKIDIVSASIAVNVQGSSTDTQTGMTFLRLGDT